MSENREDDAQEGGARIEDLPASDSELAGEESESRRGVPPVDPDDARRSSPPPTDPTSLRSPGDDDPYEPEEPTEGARSSPPPAPNPWG
jgi:hypothetical protein